MATEIAIDLDGTLLKDTYPRLGDPIEKNAEMVRQLKSKGYSITIFTARLSNSSEEEKIKAHLKVHNIPFDRITNVKPYTASVFIDDRAIPVPYNQEWSDDIMDKVTEVISMHKKANINMKRIIAMEPWKKRRLQELKNKQILVEVHGGKLSDKELNELNALVAQEWEESRHSAPSFEQMQAMKSMQLKKIQSIDFKLKKEG